MKARLLLIFAVVPLLIITSCGGDDSPEINPLVGEWELDEIRVTNPPSSYSLADGQEFATIYGESEYIITFNSDFTYIREIENTTNNGDLEDEGTWEQDGEDLILDQDSGDDDLIPLEMKILGDIDDKLSVSFGSSIFSLSDDILNDPEFQDTVTTQQQFNDVFAEFAQQISVTLELEFDKN